jgi:HEAT repeat protein
LQKQLSDLGESALRKTLKDDHAEVRSMAAYVIGRRGLHLESALIDLLDDADSGVRQSARRALVKLAHGEDFGPRPNAAKDARREAQRQWRDWLAKKGSS